jgi:hypothetical protein
LDFLMDPDNPASGSRYSRQFAMFKDGCPEDWMYWVTAFREIENLMPMKKPADKTRMFRALLKSVFHWNSVRIPSDHTVIELHDYA